MLKQKQQIGKKDIKNKKIDTKEQNKEIERKFLIHNLPDNIFNFPHKKILQAYLAVSEDSSEVRIRQHGDKYFQTIKRGNGKVRTETEIEITREQFEALWTDKIDSSIEKVRYEVPYKKTNISVDVYQGRLKGLITAEVEFTNEEDSNHFIPPDWFGQEQTEKDFYKNKNLSKNNINDYTKENNLANDIPEYSLSEGRKKLINIIHRKLSETTNNLIVQIAGGSASGKTSAVSQIIKDAFGEEALIFSCDDYYKGIKFMKDEAKKGNILNWDQPEAMDLDLFGKHLLDLKNNQPIEKPIYSMEAGVVSGTEKVLPKKIIIAEGLFVLDDILKSKGDINVFVEIGSHGRIIRRLLRDVNRTKQNPLDILKYFIQTVQPMHEKYIVNTKKNADLIINNEYSPKIEASRAGFNEKQIKFKETLDTNYLREIGAENLGSTIQEDIYFNPEDRNLKDTDEMLRIRHEGGKKIIVYKGPRQKEKFAKRPKFEFYIDNEAEQVISKIYPHITKVIKKERTLYKLSNIIFSIDTKVTKIEDNQEVELGDFIEIRIGPNGEKDFETVVKKLGLHNNQIVKKNYFEM